MGKYLVKTAFFVAEIEKDEELVQLAQVDTIQKETLIKEQPDGAWIHARELPLLMKVWGLVPEKEVPPIPPIEKPKSTVLGISSIKPPKKSSESKQASASKGGPELPPPPPKAPPQPPRLETVVDQIPRFTASASENERVGGAEDEEALLPPPAPTGVPGAGNSLPDVKSASGERRAEEIEKPKKRSSMEYMGPDDVVSYKEETHITSEFANHAEESGSGRVCVSSRESGVVSNAGLDEADPDANEETVAMARNPFFLSEEAHDTTDDKVLVGPQNDSIEIDCSSLDDEDGVTEDFSSKVKEIRAWTRASLKNGGETSSTDRVRIHKNVVPFDEDEEARTRDFAALRSLELETQTNKFHINDEQFAQIERAQTKPVMPKDVERALEEDETYTRDSFDKHRLDSLVNSIISHDALDMAQQGQIKEKRAPHADPNLVNEARLEAYRKAKEEEAARLEAERLEAERKEAERLEAERKEAERLEAERKEAARCKAAKKSVKPVSTISPEQLVAARAALEAAQKSMAAQPDADPAMLKKTASLVSALEALVNSQVEAVMEDNENTAEFAYRQRIAASIAKQNEEAGQDETEQLPKKAHEESNPAVEKPKHNTQSSSARRVQKIVTKDEDVDDSPSEQFSVHSREELSAMMRAFRKEDEALQDAARADREAREDYDDDEDSERKKSEPDFHKRYDLSHLTGGTLSDESVSISLPVAKTAPKSPAKSDDLRALFEKADELPIYLAHEIRTSESNCEKEARKDEAANVSSKKSDDKKAKNSAQNKAGAKPKVDEAHAETQMTTLPPTARKANTEVLFNELLRSGENLVLRFGSFMLTNRRVWNIEKTRTGIKNYESYDLKNVQWYALRDEINWMPLLVDILLLIVAALFSFFKPQVLFFVLFGITVVALIPLGLLSCKTTLQIGVGSAVVRSRNRIPREKHQEAMKFLDQLDQARALVQEKSED